MMSERFNSKAQNYIKNFRGFPPAIDPLWKGFPQSRWIKSLEEMDWNDSAEDLRLQKSTSIKAAFPFLPEDGFVLSALGGGVEWVGETPKHIRISRATEQKNIDAQEGFYSLSEKISIPGFKIVVSKEYDSSRPVVCVVDSAEVLGWTSFRHRIELEEGAQLSLILVNSPSAQKQSLVSNLLFGKLNPFSALNVIHIPSANEPKDHSFARLDFSLDQGSSLEVIDLGMNVHLGRCETHVSLEGKEAFASVSGIQLLGDSQTYDSRVRMIHKVADTRSRQNFKCVMADKSHGMFGGNIIIKRDAQRVDSSQSHKALLLSKGAKASAFPELEIDADDVKAAHGSSTGQLDRDQVFYLKSRGLKESDAIRLLSEAFVNDVVLKQSSSDFREVLGKILSHSLPQFVQRMETKWKRDE